MGTSTSRNSTVAARTYLEVVRKKKILRLHWMPSLQSCVRNLVVANRCGELLHSQTQITNTASIQYTHEKITRNTQNTVPTGTTYGKVYIHPHHHHHHQHTNTRARKHTHRHARTGMHEGTHASAHTQTHERQSLQAYHTHTHMHAHTHTHAEDVGGCRTTAKNSLKRIHY